MATIGKFIITSRANDNFRYEGYSKQCETMFNDYMSWCAKGKAPKILQTEYDANNAHPPKELFVIEIISMDADSFEKASSKKIARPVTIPQDFTPRSINSMMPSNAPGTHASAPSKHMEFLSTVDWSAIFDEYKNGGKVKEICARLKIDYTMFYNQIDRFLK